MYTLMGLLCKYPYKKNHEFLEGLWHSSFSSWHGTDLYWRYARPKLLLIRCFNAAINFTYWRLNSGWGKLVDGTDFIENREQGRESFPGLWGVEQAYRRGSVLHTSEVKRGCLSSPDRTKTRCCLAVINSPVGISGGNSIYWQSEDQQTLAQWPEGHR